MGHQRGVKVTDGREGLLGTLNSGLYRRDPKVTLTPNGCPEKDDEETENIKRVEGFV